MSFPTVKFGQFMTPNKRPYLLGPDEDADLLGMRLYGQGPFHREHKIASRIRKKSHFRVRAGDVIYNKLFAWKGTFGIVPEHLDGMLVSDKFPTYALDEKQAVPRYVEWFFRFPGLWEQARSLSTGSAALSKFTLNPPKFLELEIPLPSLDEQHEIAQRLTAVEMRLDEIRRTRGDSNAAATALLQAFTNAIAAAPGSLGTLEEVLTGKPRNGWSVRCDNAEDGTPVLTLGAVTGYFYDSSAIKRTSAVTSDAAHYWLEPEDLLITRSNTPELVGHVAIYDGSPSPCIYPDLIMKIPLDKSRADTRFVWHWLQSPQAREFISEKAKGTSSTMQKISQQVVMKIPFPSSLALAEQIRLRERMDLMLWDRQELDALLQESTDLLDRVIPSSLEEVFA